MHAVLRDKIISSAEMRLRLLAWGGIFLMLAADGLGLYLQGIGIILGRTGRENLQFLLGYMSACCLLYYLSFWLRAKRPYPLGAKAAYHVAVFMESFSLFLCFSLAGIVLSYVGAGIPFPYQDAYLLRCDGWLKCDWYQYGKWVNAHPALGRLLFLAYNSFVPQLMVALGLLTVLGYFRKIYEMILVLLVSSALCAVISMLFPAVGIITYLHYSPGDFNHLESGPGYLHVPVMEQLRSGTLHVLSMSASDKGLIGLITFPSYHACLAALLLWAFWQLPWLRWPALALNMLMFAAIPIIGGHYFVDVPAGIAVTVAAVAVVRYMTGKIKGQ